ncbi:hypothetical protein D3C71_21820 [compost metagenome]
MSGLFTRDRLARGASLALGVAAAMALSAALGPKIALVLPPAPAPASVPVKVAVSAPKPKSAPEPLPVAAATVPLRSQQAPAAPKVPTGPAAQAVPEPKVTVLQEDLPTLAQPSQPQLEPREPVAQDVPEAPDEFDIGQPELKTYPEKPGGNVLVVGLLVNDRGTVIDARVLVPSYNPLTDISVAMASVGQVWRDITPPLGYGETRWIELRIPFTPEDKRQDLLP